MTVQTKQHTALTTAAERFGWRQTQLLPFARWLSWTAGRRAGRAVAAVAIAVTSPPAAASRARGGSRGSPSSPVGFRVRNGGMLGGWSSESDFAWEPEAANAANAALAEQQPVTLVPALATLPSVFALLG